MSDIEQPSRENDKGVGPVARDSLTGLVYNNLRQALMEGRFWPGHRFKIRELAAAMNVSETPIREALMQLVRGRAGNAGWQIHHRRSHDCQTVY